MSVPKDQRTESKLLVFVLARDLASYTLQITSNEKIFLPQLHACTDEIIKLAIRINTELWSANNIIVNSQLNFKLRKLAQESACRDCNALLATILIAAKLFHLSAKRMKYWGSKIILVRNKTRAWKESDAKRYALYR